MLILVLLFHIKTKRILSDARRNACLDRARLKPRDKAQRSLSHAVGFPSIAPDDPAVGIPSHHWTELRSWDA